MSAAVSSLYYGFLKRVDALSRLEKVFLLLVLVIPFQKKFKIFHSLSSGWNAPFAFPAAFQKAIYFYISDLFLIALGVYFIVRVGLKFFEGGAKFLSAFFIVALLSTLLSTTSTYPLHYVRLTHLFLFVVLFCLLSKEALFRDRVGMINRVFWILFFLSLFECAVGLGQYFLQGAIGLKYLGEGAVSAAFYAPNGKLWIFDQLFHVTREIQMIKRASGTFLHPNLFGGFMFMTTLVSYHLFSLAGDNKRRLLLAVAIFFQVFTLCTTFSRSGLIALFIATLLWLFLRRREKPLIKQVGLLFFISLALSFLLLFPALNRRGGVVNYNEVSKASDQERLLFQDIATGMIEANPWIGVGYNSYLLHMQDHYVHQLQAVQFFPVHNIYLLVAAEEGMIGLLLFLLFLGAVIRRGMRSERASPASALLCMLIGFLFIGGCDFYLLGSQHGKLLLFLVAGLLNGGVKNEFSLVN